MKTAAQKQSNAPILTVLLGKKVFFSGKFDRGEEGRLRGMAEAQCGIVSGDLDSSVNYLVVPDLSQGKTVQKKMTSLNAKGATIQLIDRADFYKSMTPTAEQVLAIIRSGTANAGLLSKALGQIAGSQYLRAAGPIVATIANESFEGLDLSAFKFDGIAFDHCSFKGCTISDASFYGAADCDFSKSVGEGPRFFGCTRNRFIAAVLTGPAFAESIADSDFSSAHLKQASFNGRWKYLGAAMMGRQVSAPGINAVFSSAALKESKFNAVSFKSVDFDQADLSETILQSCTFESAGFREAVAPDSAFIECQLKDANFAYANLTRANFGGSDLTDANFAGADVQLINLASTRIAGVDFSKARNYNPNALSTGPTGPALIELDSLCVNARRIAITFQVKDAKDDKTHEVGVDSRGLRWGGALRLPPELMRRGYHRQRGLTLSEAIKQLAGIVPACAVQFGTIEVSSTKSPKTGKELREIVMNAISEAFNQPVPSADDLAAATKAFRETQKEQNAADKERREKAAKLAEKQKISAKRIINKKIEKEVGKVTDIATFLKALELRADKSKIDKATKMLKAERFQLFNDITDTHLTGVVKSQTDADLVYACRIESDGQYACCTQNLNICGGLRGSICKHLLVLIIGLVKAEKLDPSNIDAWIAKSHDTKPELNKETMGEIFIRYKGAEAGEVDWRPTETVPEDYYAV